MANAPGTGVADDKAIYAYVPGNDSLLPRSRIPILANVETYVLTDQESARSCGRKISNEMVVKAVGESGGYGMLIGPHSTAAEQREISSA